MSQAVMQPLVGQTLSQQLMHSVLAGAAHIEPPKLREPLEWSLKRELVQFLTSAHAKERCEVELPTVQEYVSPAKFRRTREAIDESFEDKTQQVRVLLSHNLSLVHLPETVVDADRLRQQLLRQPEEPTGVELSKRLTTGDNLRKHMILLDSSLDSLLKEDLRAMRELDPGAFGVALATDESPPSQRRFGGYRFQVTMVYIPQWRPMDTWDACTTPPLHVVPRLLDICHCPGKDGASVMQVLDKQLGRVGLSRYDVASLSGDGGAENEGALQGIHATLESDVSGYVRRRCLGHLAWRVADAVLAEIPGYEHTKKVCEYLRDGVTWTRLQALASAPVADNGLGLFRERSLEFKRVFGKAPHGILDGRPTTDLHLLEFLRGREHVLFRTATRDVQDRSLAAKKEEAVATLGNHVGRAVRRMACEMVQRSLFMYFWVEKHTHVGAVESLESLAHRARDILQDVSLDDVTLERLGCSDASLAAKGWPRPSTWLALVALLEFDDQGLSDRALPAIAKIHWRLVAKGTAHLELVVHNIMRTSRRGAAARPCTRAE